MYDFELKGRQVHVGVGMGVSVGVVGGSPVCARLYLHVCLVALRVWHPDMVMQCAPPLMLADPS